MAEQVRGTGETPSIGTGPANPIRLAIVDNQLAFVEALASSFINDDRFKVIGTATTTDSGFELMMESDLDVAIIDYRFDGAETGIDLAVRVRSRSNARRRGTGSDVPIAILTGYAAPGIARRAAQLEGVEVVSKKQPISSLKSTLVSLSAGNVSDTPIDNVPADLTASELEVLELLVGGLKVQDMADRLFISVHAIRQRMKSMKKKLGVSSQLAAVLEGIKLGLIVPPNSTDRNNTD